ncbi:MAG: thioesterase family protein [Opitutales bacterium]
MPSEFSITRQVEFAETDLAGIMHFTYFYRWMEVCEHAFLRSLGLSVDLTTGDQRIGWPRVKTSCRFKRPLRFEDEVEVCLIVTEIRDRSIAYGFEFWKTEDGERIKAAAGETIAACVSFDPETHVMTPVPIPEVFRSKMEEASSGQEED